MQKKYITTAIILGLFNLSFLFSTTITLSEALELARIQNVSLALQSVDVEGAKRDVDTSWNLFIPTVSLSLSTSGRTPVFQAAQTIMGPNTASNTGLSVGLGASFTLNPAVKDQLDTYQLSYSIARLSYEQAKSEVERNVTKLFYYLLMEQQNITVQEANIALARKQYEQVKAQYELGFASEIELLSAQLAYERLYPALQQAQNQYESQLLSLKVLLGIDFDSELNVIGEIPKVVEKREVHDLNGYLQKSYSIALLDMNKTQLQQNYELNKKQALSPSLTLQGSYDISLWNEAYTNTFSDSFSYQVLVRIPLDGYLPNSRTQVGLAKIDDALKKLSYQRQQALVQLEHSIISQVKNLDMLASQQKLAMQNLELTERLYEMHTIQYESGYTSFIALQEAQNNLLSARQNLLALQYQYLSATIDLLYDLNIRDKELL
ncbi:MAG: TolC family protein [Spirochaetia bacterium]|nr:TolC family protein [Spirochaetia bacterium]